MGMKSIQVERLNMELVSQNRTNSAENIDRQLNKNMITFVYYC